MRALAVRFAWEVVAMMMMGAAGQKRCFFSLVHPSGVRMEGKKLIGLSAYRRKVPRFLAPQVARLSNTDVDR